jgi:hypothetical protein
VIVSPAAAVSGAVAAEAEIPLIAKQDMIMHNARTMLMSLRVIKSPLNFFGINNAVLSIITLNI